MVVLIIVELTIVVVIDLVLILVIMVVIVIIVVVVMIVVIITVIYKALCFDVAQGQMNGAPNETRTHSCRFASLAC